MRRFSCENSGLSPHRRKDPLIPAFVLPLVRSHLPPSSSLKLFQCQFSTSEHKPRKVFLNNLNGVLMPKRGEAWGSRVFPMSFRA